MSRVLGVIPARFTSTRFPGKPLAPLGNRSMIEQVWSRARSASALDRLIVATDDARIRVVAERFGAEVMMTSSEHVSGTDRVAEVVGRLEDRNEADTDYSFVVNIQGDEPLLTPASLERLVEALRSDPAPEMATLSEPIRDVEELFDPNTVKLVTSRDGRALYFSRSPIPFHRGAVARMNVDFRTAVSDRADGLEGYLKHQGLYGYSRSALMQLARMEPSLLERDEGLEQLRALEAGFAIQVVPSDFRSHGVDTPEDLARVARMLTS